MIAFLRGKLLEKHPNQVIVDTAGVGYDVVIPISTFSSLPDTGAEVALRIHTHVREDALSLFGFLTSEEKALFEKLISVSGIGPRLPSRCCPASPRIPDSRRHTRRAGRATGANPGSRQEDRRTNGFGAERQTRQFGWRRCSGWSFGEDRTGFQRDRTRCSFGAA